MRLSTGGQSLRQSFDILKDSRLTNVSADIQAEFDLALKVRDRTSDANRGVINIRACTGVAKDYTAAMTASIVSSARDAALGVADPSATAPGHLVNRAFSLPRPLAATASSPGGTTAAGGVVSGSPVTLETWAAPASNDPIAIAFTQSIGADDALRTGSHGKTLTFTLSTTTP